MDALFPLVVKATEITTDGFSFSYFPVSFFIFLSRVDTRVGRVNYAGFTELRCHDGGMN